MFDALRSKDVWKHLTYRYPQGGQWDHDTANLVVDVIMGLNEGLSTLRVPFRFKMSFRNSTTRVGYKVRPIKGLTILGPSRQVPVKFKVAISRAQIGNRRIDLGHEGAVVALANELLDELEVVMSSEAYLLEKQAPDQIGVKPAP